jgi:hypothetical protein
MFFLLIDGYFSPFPVSERVSIWGNIIGLLFDFFCPRMKEVSSGCKSECFSLPSISEMLLMDGFNCIKLPALHNKETCFESSAVIKTVQQTNTLGSKCSTLDTTQSSFSKKVKSPPQEKNSSVSKSSKMKKVVAPTPYLTFDSKTLEEVNVLENSNYPREDKKPKWIFEENILQKRGRKGKPKEWQLKIQNIKNCNKN